MISAILIAAGESKRMGAANKLLLELKGEPLVYRTASTLLASAADEVVAVLGHKAEAVEAALRGKVRTVFNPNYSRGMTTSIQAGVLACSEQTRAYLICLADLAFLQVADVNRIIETWKAAQSNAIAAPIHGSKRGNPVVFSSDYREDILACQEMNGCKSVIKKHQDKLQLVAMDNDHCLRDMDHPEDYQLIKQALT